MFPARAFAPRFFAPRYFAKAGQTVFPGVGSITTNLMLLKVGN